MGRGGAPQIILRAIAPYLKWEMDVRRDEIKFLLYNLVGGEGWPKNSGWGVIPPKKIPDPPPPT